MRAYYPKPRLGDSTSAVHLGELPPILRALLISDGTETRLLEAYYWELIEIKVLFHGKTKMDEAIDALETAKGATLLQRRVLICGAQSGRNYSHAESFIRADFLAPEVEEDLVHGRLGIGEALRLRRTETYRELLSCSLVTDPAMAQQLGVGSNEALIRRSYRILANRAPLLYIIEHLPISLYV